MLIKLLGLTNYKGTFYQNIIYREWDRWLVMGIIGFLVGVTGNLITLEGIVLKSIYYSRNKAELYVKSVCQSQNQLNVLSMKYLHIYGYLLKHVCVILIFWN